MGSPGGRHQYQVRKPPPDHVFLRVRDVTNKQTATPPEVQATVAGSGVSGPAGGTAAPHPKVFLNLHQRLGPLGALLPPPDLALLLSNRLVPRIGRRRLRTPRLWREPCELAPIPRRAPGRQVRGVQPLAPQQRAEFPRLRAAVRLPHDPPLVLRRESSPLCLGHHLRLPRHRRRARENSSRPTGSFRFPEPLDPLTPLLHDPHPSLPPRPLQ